MNEREFGEVIAELLSSELDINCIRFFDAGVQTLDEGLVTTTPDGDKFQLTIRRV